MLSLRHVAPFLLGCALLLTACSSAAGAGLDAGVASDTAATDGADLASAGGADPASGTCPAVPQQGFELFSSDIVAQAPRHGALYGEGHPVSWAFSRALEYGPSVDLYYVNEAGDAIAMGGTNTVDEGDNTWSVEDPVYWSEANGRPGFVILTVTNSITAEEGSYRADTEIAGVYCVTFVTSE